MLLRHCCYETVALLPMKALAVLLRHIWDATFRDMAEKWCYPDKRGGKNVKAIAEIPERKIWGKPTAHHPVKCLPLVTEEFKVKQPGRQPQRNLLNSKLVWWDRLDACPSVRVVYHVGRKVHCATSLIMFPIVRNVTGKVLSHINLALYCGQPHE